MKSGVTTREQLQVAVNALQMLVIGAVGFVLNRVSFGKAEPAFRQSLLDMENRLRTQGGPNSIWPVKWHGFVNERVPVPEYPLESREQPAHPRTSADAPVQKSAKVNVDRPPQPEAKAPSETEKPWWMPEMPPAKSDRNPACATAPIFTEKQSSAPLRIQAPKLPDWFWNSDSGGSGEFMQIPTQEVADKAPMLSSESRIERLRALFENVGLADLHRSRVPLSDVGQQSARQNENPAPAIKAAAESEAVVSAVSHSTGANIEPAPTSILPRESVPVKEPALEDEIRILPAKRGQYSSH